MNPIEIKSQPPQNSVRGSDLFLFCLPTKPFPASWFFAAGWPCGWAAGHAQQLENNGLPVACAQVACAQPARHGPTAKASTHDVLCKGHLLNGTTPMKLQAIFFWGPLCFPGRHHRFGHERYAVFCADMWREHRFTY